MVMKITLQRLIALQGSKIEIVNEDD
jgi:hypothetical protein